MQLECLWHIDSGALMILVGDDVYTVARTPTSRDDPTDMEAPEWVLIRNAEAQTLTPRPATMGACLQLIYDRLSPQTGGDTTREAER